MNTSAIVDVSSSIALIVLGLSLLLSAVRIWIGPTLADRILALDLLTVVAMGLVGALAIRTGAWLYIDIALALALVGFLATLALVRYLLGRRVQQESEP